MPKKTKTPKPRTTIGLLGDAIPVVANIGLLSETDSYYGQSPLQKLGYAVDAAENGNWTDPNNGVGINLSEFGHAAVDNIVSVDGVLIEGLAFGARHLIKGSSLRRMTLFKTKHHRFTVG